jgi:hypothetical protein
VEGIKQQAAALTAKLPQPPTPDHRPHPPPGQALTALADIAKHPEETFVPTHNPVFASPDSDSVESTSTTLSPYFDFDAPPATASAAATPSTSSATTTQQPNSPADSSGKPRRGGGGARGKAEGSSEGEVGARTLLRHEEELQLLREQNEALRDALCSIKKRLEICKPKD